jgi:Spy/CpxP family protein refolding chaperone
MNTLTRIAITLAALTLVASAALAQPGTAPRHQRGMGPGAWAEADGGPGPQMRLERLAAFLDLTDAQVAAIEAIHEQARADGVELRKELARLRNQKQGEMLKDEPSRDALVEITREMGDVRTRLQVNRLETRLAVRAELTDEQRDQLLASGRHGGPGGGRGGHGLRGGHGGCGGPGDCDRGPGKRGARAPRRGNR